MANTFQLEILASDRPFYVGPAEQLVFPTVDGLMGILPGHESMVTVVSPGELKYLVDGQWHYAAISDGFAEVRRDYVLVLGDDITQAPGKLRIRPSGSAGGHNGLKSIIARLGGDGFPRIRIGVGAKPRPDYDLADWVLGKFPAEDAKALADRCPDLEAAAKLIMDGKLGLAQSKYNG